MGVRKKLYKAAFQVLQRSGLGQAMAPLTQGCGAIFMLHRVKPASAAPFQPNSHLEIEPDFLRKAVAHIRSNGYEIISIDEAVDLLKSGYGRKRYAVLTFDDGYRDNLEVAYPLLRELNAPFIVYVASGLIDRTTEMWWTALERIIAANDEIHLTGDDGGAGISCRTPEEKYHCYNKMCAFLGQEVSEVEQRAIIRRLAEKYGLDLTALADELMMSWDEVRQLASDPLVTIGAHTHNHYAVARLGEAEALQDIDKGVTRLEEELGRRPKHFAYPYGNARAASARDASLLRDYGFSSAVTTFPGVLKSVNARDPMMLPRVSLNGHFQDGYVIDQYLTGAPFALYKSLKWLR
jgi:peptidoglycan/xylan/chitin deacetylase (PgdA/CDA1 family)